MTLAAGIDLGTGAVKAAIFRVEDGQEEWLARETLRIRSRDPMVLSREAFDRALEEAGLKEADIDYIATTGEGESLEWHTGHFYSMTSHARGARYLEPRAEAILD
ncbi:MAG TPA: benzoyl-CoA reductase subunit D, partial [Aliiroseovarius sp.]|nr:benzoyl-CoA reductase subunit D [Aliiroseovarius sp.]